jgi:hypothetical protein
VFHVEPSAVTHASSSWHHTVIHVGDAGGSFARETARMPRRQDPQHSDVDTKARRKQEEIRRMRFRRAIEDYAEARRLQSALSDYPDLLAAGQLHSAPGTPRRQTAARKSAPPAP